MIGRSSRLSQDIGIEMALAVPKGRARAKFLGISSPSIATRFAMRSARPIATTGRSVTPSHPIRSSSGSNIPESAGSAIAPVMSEVIVIPSWAPDSSNESRESDFST